MNDLYDIDAYCMDFSNEEIEEYLIIPLGKDSEIAIKADLSDPKNRIVSFDGDTENFTIMFWGHQTAIFISDEGLRPKRKISFNEEFMFIDDNLKKIPVPVLHIKMLFMKGI